MFCFPSQRGPRALFPKPKDPTEVVLRPPSGVELSGRRVTGDSLSSCSSGQPHQP